MHLNTVRKLCRDGRLRTAVDIGGRWLIDLQEVKDYEPRSWWNSESTRAAILAGARKPRKRRQGDRICPSATNEEIDFLRSRQDWSAPELAAHLGHPIDWVRDRRMFMRRLEGEEAWPKRQFTHYVRMRKGDDQADRICDLARDGKSLDDIHSEVGISISAIRRILRENHVRTAGQAAWSSGTGYGLDAVQQVKKLRAECKSWRQTAEITGLPMSTSRKLAVLPERGTAVEQRKEKIRAEILDLVARTGGCSIRAVADGVSGGHYEQVRQEIRHLIEAGLLRQTRGNSAKILTVNPDAG